MHRKLHVNVQPVTAEHFLEPCQLPLGGWAQSLVTVAGCHPNEEEAGMHESMESCAGSSLLRVAVSGLVWIFALLPFELCRHRSYKHCESSSVVLWASVAQARLCCCCLCRASSWWGSEGCSPGRPRQAPPSPAGTTCANAPSASASCGARPAPRPKAGRRARWASWRLLTSGTVPLSQPTWRTRRGWSGGRTGPCRRALPPCPWTDSSWWSCPARQRILPRRPRKRKAHLVRCFQNYFWWMVRAPLALPRVPDF